MKIVIISLTKIKNKIHNKNIKVSHKLFSKIIYLLQRNKFTKTHIIFLLIVKNITNYLNKSLVKNFLFLTERSNLFHIGLINN